MEGNRPWHMWVTNLKDTHQRDMLLSVSVSGSVFFPDLSGPSSWAKSGTQNYSEYPFNFVVEVQTIPKWPVLLDFHHRWTVDHSGAKCPGGFTAVIELRATSEASKESEGIQYITLRIACFEHLKLNFFFETHSCRLHGLNGRKLKVLKHWWVEFTFRCRHQGGFNHPLAKPRCLEDPG